MGPAAGTRSRVPGSQRLALCSLLPPPGFPHMVVDTGLLGSEQRRPEPGRLRCEPQPLRKGSSGTTWAACPARDPQGRRCWKVRRGWLRPLEARDESRGRAFPKARGLRCRQMKLQTSVPYRLCVSLYGLLCLGDERRTVA